MTSSPIPALQPPRFNSGIRSPSRDKNHASSPPRKNVCFPPCREPQQPQSLPNPAALPVCSPGSRPLLTKPKHPAKVLPQSTNPLFGMMTPLRTTLPLSATSRHCARTNAHDRTGLPICRAYPQVSPLFRLDPIRLPPLRLLRFRPTMIPRVGRQTTRVRTPRILESCLCQSRLGVNP
jgi:hypothetical protein